VAQTYPLSQHDFNSRAYSSEERNYLRIRKRKRKKRLFDLITMKKNNFDVCGWWQLQLIEIATPEMIEG